ncbi:hypothetical protein DPMN_080022 [Dreissena polymorpha]|uniref:Uncharacterized protein n=1 Tax=Dreissena polymorpha TaxID=45954 RepID=A0A9D3YU75_DREPO|nr:hypothetical protein DPMN_080022 [Dreissena polymorpha]
MDSEHPGGHVFQQTGYILVHIQNIIKTNILTKKNAPYPCSHDIIGTILVTKVHEDQTINYRHTNLLTKFHDDLTINVASRMQTRFHYSHIMKNAPPPGGNVFQPTHTLFKLFHDYRTRNVASRALARKNAPPPGGHVFQPTHTIFKLNLLTKFHDDRTINVISIVKNALPLGAILLTRSILGNMPRPPGSHVFQATVIIFEHAEDIVEINLTKFHEDKTINVASLFELKMPGGHVFQPTQTSCELVQDIIWINLLTKFHEILGSTESFDVTQHSHYF